MTILTLAWALKRAAVPDDPLAHLVLIGLADHTSDDGTGAFPSVRTLAGYARCTPRTVQAKLRLLEASSLIRRGDQRLVDRLPANRRPVVWDLVMTDAPATPTRTNPAGVILVHPKTPPVDNPRLGVNEDSPQDVPPVENRHSGVSTGSPQNGSWGERPRRPGVNVSSYKPPIKELLQPSVPRPSTERLVHRSGDRRRDRCHAHQHLAVPVPCWDCRDVREAADAAVAVRLVGLTHIDGLPVGGVCEHGGEAGIQLDGRPRCPSCRGVRVTGAAPWDAEPERCPVPHRVPAGAGSSRQERWT